MILAKHPNTQAYHFWLCPKGFDSQHQDISLHCSHGIVDQNNQPVPITDHVAEQITAKIIEKHTGNVHEGNVTPNPDSNPSQASLKESGDINISPEFAQKLNAIEPGEAVAIKQDEQGELKYENVSSPIQISPTGEALIKGGILGVVTIGGVAYVDDAFRYSKTASVPHEWAMDYYKHRIRYIKNYPYALNRFFPLSSMRSVSADIAYQRSIRSEAYLLFAAAMLATTAILYVIHPYFRDKLANNDN